MRNIPTVKRKIQRLVTQAGIYHNPSLGLISLSSDGENWSTMADKNLGATQIWNEGDDVTASNAGNYYQRGNNYGFPYGEIPTKTNNTQLDVTGYSCDNPYISDVYNIYGSRWGRGVDFEYLRGYNQDVLKQRGPCPEGYHLPVDYEWGDILLGLSESKRREVLKMPPITYIEGLDFVGQKANGNYLTFTCNPPYEEGGIYYFLDGSVELGYDENMSVLHTIRPFKNEPVVPTSERIILYQPN